MKVNTAKLKEIRKRMQEMREQLTEECKVVFVDAVTELFTGHEDLDSFAWRQYTDYYCDGGPCDFSAQIDEDSIVINGADPYGDEEIDEKTTKRYAKIAKDVSKILTTIGEENLEMIFGDHAEIIVKRNGDIEVEEYTEHD